MQFDASTGTIRGTPDTATVTKDSSDAYDVTFTGTGDFGDATTNIIVRVYAYKPADKDALLTVIETEIKKHGIEADLNNIDTSLIKDMSELFKTDNGPYFSGDVSKWDVSKVTTMYAMFNNAKEFNNDLSLWNVEKVTNMNSMFSNAYIFNGDIRNWNVSNVENMTNMFTATIQFNQDISGWNVGRVKKMLGMFSGAKRFKQDLTDWKTSIQKNTVLRFIFLKSNIIDRLIPCWYDKTDKVKACP